ncbi:MAG TPA: DNA methyltransferase [Anaerolineaceae bacterium]|nr:DNA methyltransferase [Anaerolineaceae bacterium]
MASLDPTLRKFLENKVPDARQFAEEAARAILNTLAVNRPEPFPALTPDQRRLRNALRAKARQLGNGSQTEGFEPLVEDLAYQQWHRMVFARFLAENNLLMHPSGVPVTLQECGELALEEGELDAWGVAAKYAALMLPGIFRQDDPESQVRFAPEGQQKLETVLNNLPSPVFLADDALGWMYQFWQSRKKEEINRSERKIGGADLAPVTQLFTEDYMVRFLLENSLGAWWAAHHPASPLVKTWQYLRFKEDGSSAAGGFPGWPERAAEVTIMDPCCGSGHFLVAAFDMLVQMRMEEEGLSKNTAADAVLFENLFGLEIDQRCTQIAAFALALAAWKSGGYRLLPVPNVACSGIPVQGQLETWLKLAGEDVRLRAGLERLYGLFKNAPDLGSLINPADLPAADRMFVADYEQVAPVLEQALKNEFNTADPVAEVFGVAAEGVVRATRLLSGKYTLIATNVPYLMRGKQNDILRNYCDLYHPLTKADLSAVFVERCFKCCVQGGSVIIVSPQNWLYQLSYKAMREYYLRQKEWNLVVRLGVGAFETISGEIVNVSLFIGTNFYPSPINQFTGIDLNEIVSPIEKAKALITKSLITVSQKSQIDNPDSRVTLGETGKGELFSIYTDSLQGVSPADEPHYGRCFWELGKVDGVWKFWQSTVKQTAYYSGREHILWLNESFYKAKEIGKAYIRGEKAWGKLGVAVSLMGDLPVTLYTGQPTDTNMAILLPRNTKYLNAIWAFCSSSEFNKAVRQIDRALKVTNGSLIKIPFDLKRWQKAAEEAGPLPKPFSDDPTQWLFEGHPCGSEVSLQVAVERLLGYRWPQNKPDNLNEFIDEGGIICLPAVAGEAPLSDRLRTLLAAAYGSEWSGATQEELLSRVGHSGKDLSEWLRDGFFEQHCRLFHNRPFIWHIWDGRKDGFSALVNYHKLTTANLERLIYTYLGDWINFQRGRRDHGEPGADGRLVAAIELQNKLKLIREGETPYDIYVRWKSLAEQSIGWEPNLNDGVRLNIRPFVTAGVLRSKFNINWNKDRGKNTDGSDRVNDIHLTIAEKAEARMQKIISIK